MVMMILHQALHQLKVCDIQCMYEYVHSCIHCTAILHLSMLSTYLCFIVESGDDDSTNNIQETQVVGSATASMYMCILIHSHY